MKRCITIALLFTVLASACSRMDGSSQWIRQAHDANLQADRAIRRGDGESARKALVASLDQPVPGTVNPQDSRMVKQDMCFRLSLVEMDAKQPKAALAWARRGLELGQQQDLPAEPDPGAPKGETVTRIFAAVLCLSCAGCAAQKAMQTEPLLDPAPKVAEYEQAMQQIEAELERSLQVAARPECPRVCELGGTICKLAQKICQIANRNPQHESLKARCQDARARCEAAQRKVSEHCECTTLDF